MRWDTERRVTTPEQGLRREMLDPPSHHLHQPSPCGSHSRNHGLMGQGAADRPGLAGRSRQLQGTSRSPVPSHDPLGKQSMLYRYFCFNLQKHILSTHCSLWGRDISFQQLGPGKPRRARRHRAEPHCSRAAPHSSTPLLLGECPVLCVFTFPISSPVPMTLRMLNE